MCEPGTECTPGELKSLFNHRIDDLIDVVQITVERLNKIEQTQAEIALKLDALTAALSTMSEVKKGTTVSVNHNYGGVDNLKVVSTPPGWSHNLPSSAVLEVEREMIAGDKMGILPVENANIYAYLKSDWDAGLHGSQYCKGWSMTNGDGRWSWSIYLEQGEYYLILDRPNPGQKEPKLLVVK